MTQLLIRCFIKNSDKPTSPKVRTAYGRLASFVGIACNVFLFVCKFLVGTVFGSIAITADAINNLSDASSNIVSLLGFQLAAKKPDEKHPFGYARYEYLAGLAVSVMILAIGLSLFKESLLKVIHPAQTAFSWLSVIVLLGSILIKLWMSRFNSTIGKTIDSDTLLATAADSRNDVISTAAVLVATVLIRLTNLAVIDGIMGLGVAVFILVAGAGLVRDTLSPLLGETPDPALVRHIEETVLSYPNVLGMHDLMVHDYGPGQQFASLHIEFPAEADVLETHDEIDNIERDFRKNDQLLVTIHYDPIVTSDSAVGEMWTLLSEKLKAYDPTLSMHDLRLVPGPTHTNVVFDLVLPAGYKGNAAEAIKMLREAAKEKNENTYCVIQIDQSYTALV